MRIMVAHSSYRSNAPSGENHVVAQESQALKKAGHVVTLFERSSDDIADWPLTRKLALPVASIRNPAVRRDLVRELRRFRPEVVHVHNTFPMLSASVLTACRDEDVPVVTTLHNYKLLCASGDFFRRQQPCHDCATGDTAPALLHRCYRQSLPATAAVTMGTVANRRAWRELVSAYIFISAEQMRLMSGLRLPTDRSFVKHNFVPPFPTGPCEDRDHSVVYVGRLDLAKGADLLMRSWDLFRAQGPGHGLRLVIAGGGPLEDEVVEWARARPEVTFAGRQSRANVGAMLGRATAAVVPSAWEETFGLVAVEAMSQATAPIVSRHGAFPELVTDGLDGVFFAPGEAGELAAALARVDSDPGRFRAMGVQGVNTYRERFHQNRAASQLHEIYQFAVSRPVGHI